MRGYLKVVLVGVAQASAVVGPIIVHSILSESKEGVKEIFQQVHNNSCDRYDARANKPNEEYVGPVKIPPILCR